MNGLVVKGFWFPCSSEPCKSSNAISAAGYREQQQTVQPLFLLTMCNNMLQPCKVLHTKFMVFRKSWMLWYKVHNFIVSSTFQLPCILSFCLLAVPGILFPVSLFSSISRFPSCSGWMSPLLALTCRGNFVSLNSTPPSSLLPWLQVLSLTFQLCLPGELGSCVSSSSSAHVATGCPPLLHT